MLTYSYITFHVIHGGNQMKRRVRKILKGSFIKTIERLFDLVVVFGSIIVYAILEHYFMSGTIPDIFQKVIETLNSAMSYSIYMIIVFFLFRIYSPSIFERSFLSSMKSITVTLFLANTALIIVTFIFGSQMLFSPMGVFGVVIIQLLIFSIYKFISHKYLSRLVLSSAMIIGTKEEANELALEFFQDKDHNKVLKIVAYEINGKLPDNLYDMMKDVDDIYITPSLIDSNKHRVLQHAIAQAGKDVHLVPRTYEISLINSKDESIDDTLVLHIPVMRLSPEQRFIKRTVDIVVSGIALLVLAPFFLIVAILIKLNDGGPIFYRQERYKRNNELFKVYKFRSMRVDQHPDELNKRPAKNDSRITKIGKFIRATRFDELPQLINVLKGDMSLVGPRPLFKDESDEAMKEIPEFYYRSNVKPGLTGLAQVKGKYDTKDKEKIRYDLLYVKKSSFWFDLKILILTVKVLFSKGSVTEDENHASIQDVLNQHKRPFVESDNYIVIGIEK